MTAIAAKIQAACRLARQEPKSGGKSPFFRPVSSPATQGRGSAKVMIAFLCAVFCLLFGPAVDHGKAQSPEAYISADVQFGHTELFYHEVVPLTLTVESKGVMLTKNLSLTSLPDRNLIRISEKQEYQPERRREGNMVVVKNRYGFLVLATATGTVEYTPVVTVGILVKRKMGGFFGGLEEQQQAMTLKPIKVSILPLPEKGRPADFSGAVGQFALKVDPSATSIVAGDVITMTIRVTGAGYLGDLKPPQVSESPDFKVYDPRLISESGATNRVYEQSIVPQTTNATVIPAVCFSYFDPSTVSYKTATSGLSRIQFHAPVVDKPTRYVPRETAAATVQPGRTDSEATRQRIVIAITICAIFLGILAVRLVLVRCSGVGRKGYLVSMFAIVLFIFLLLHFHANRQGMLDARLACMTRNATATIGPSINSRKSFNLPQNRTIRIVATHGNWVMVESEEKRGWIPADAIRQ